MYKVILKKRKFLASSEQCSREKLGRRVSFCFSGPIKLSINWSSVYRKIGHIFFHLYKILIFFYLIYLDRKRERKPRMGRSFKYILEELISCVLKYIFYIFTVATRTWIVYLWSPLETLFQSSSGDQRYTIARMTGVCHIRRFYVCKLTSWGQSWRTRRGTSVSL